MAVLHPHKSIPNVVVSLTIHDDACVQVWGCFQKRENIVEGRANCSLYLGFGGERQIEPSSG